MSRPRITSPMVLLADENHDQHVLCSAYFPTVALVLLHAYTPEQCLALVRAARPAVIILHARRQGVFTPSFLGDLEEIGFEVAQRLIILTADGGLCELPGLRRRVAECIVKPCSVVELAEWVHELS